MARYRLTQPFIGTDPEMVVRDAQGAERFRVAGTWLALSVTLTGPRSDDGLQLVPSGGASRWELLDDGQTVGVLVSMGFLSGVYALRTAEEPHLMVRQRALVLGLDAVFSRPGVGQIATARSDGWSLSRVTLDVGSEPDERLVVACVVALLMMRHNG